MPPPASLAVDRISGAAKAFALIGAALLGAISCGGDLPDYVNQAADFEPKTLLDAVLIGDRGAVERFLAQGASVNATEADGTTLLMRAVHGGFPDIAKVLIDAGANASATNRYGVNSLYLAARADDVVSTRELLAAGADANMSLPEGETALMTAAKAGNTDIVQTLLGQRFATAGSSFARGSEPSGLQSTGYGTAALGGAGTDNRADPNAKEGWYGQTALMWAAAENHADVVALLVAAGANVNERSRTSAAPGVTYERLQGDFVYPRTPTGGLTALHFAARKGAIDALRALLDSGANIDAVDAEGVSAALYATLNGHFDAAAALLEAGADPNIADSYGRTVLFAAVNRRMPDAVTATTAVPPVSRTALDVLELALAKRADPNVPLTDRLPVNADERIEPNPILDKGATPFFRAAMLGDLGAMTLLLEAGADPLVATDVREPAADAPAPSGGTTALMAAAGVGWRASISRGREADAIAALELLLARGADVNASNQLGDTALHGATLRGSTALIRFLVEHGADVRAKNRKGQTPLDIAMGVPAEQIPYNEATATLLRRLTQPG